MLFFFKCDFIKKHKHHSCIIYILNTYFSKLPIEHACNIHGFKICPRVHVDGHCIDYCNNIIIKSLNLCPDIMM